MIKFPNTFNGDNITVKAQLEKEADLSRLYDDIENLDEELLKQIIKVKNLFITFSNMDSTINEKDWIKYSEVIIKIPVIIDKKNYLFPIITFVTNKYSLIRGFYWGFNKDDKCLFKNKGDIITILKDDVINLKIPTTRSYKNRIDRPNLLKSDMILYGASEIMQSPNVLVTLDVRNYKLEEESSFRIKEIKLGTILENNVTANEVYFTKDKFELGQVKKINKNKEVRQ